MHKYLIRFVMAAVALTSAHDACCHAAAPRTSSNTELFKLNAADRDPFRVFGSSVAVSGHLALVGAPGAGNGGFSPGSAHLFDVSTGEELWNFTSSEAAPQHQFGSSVDISGNRAIVGAYGDRTAGAGAAYLFDVITGQELFKLVVDDGQIGNAVAISGNVAVVGSYSDAAYLFDVTTGQQLFKLTASDTVPNDYFGYSVDISGNTAIVGSLNNGAYLFDVTTGQELLKLTDPDPAAHAFGQSVAISGNKALVGSPLIGSAAAYVFDATTGQPLAELIAPESPDLLGTAVAIDGDTALVGGWSYEESTRSAFLFDAVTGQQRGKLIPSDDAALHFQEVNFGEAVALSGNVAVVGFSQDVAFTGSAYVYSIVPEPAGIALAATVAAAIGLRRARRRIALPCLLMGLSIASSGQVARADIFQWEYIDPANPALGKQASTTLAPNGAGARVGPGAVLTNLNLTKAYLVGADVSPFLDCVEEACYITYTDLTGTTLAQADLTNASLYGAILTDADVTGAEIRGANFNRYYQGDAGGLTTVQLYSTASYQAQDLSGIGLSGYNLAGINLVGQNLAGASLINANLSQANLTDANFSGYDSYPYPPMYSALLTGANLSQANLTNASFGGFLGFDGEGDYYFNGADLAGANLVQANLTGAEFWLATLTNANLSGANLRGASFSAADLTGANLTGADVRGANFNREWVGVPFSGPVGGITPTQLYSTASYQTHDLEGISLHGNYPGINLAGQNLVGASFSVAADLSGGNFSNANLTHVFFIGTNLTNANFSGANLTDGSIGDMVSGANFSNAVIRGATVWGLSKAQIYSTASYQTGDLTGIYFYSSQTNWNFSGKNLTGATFQGAVDMSGSSFAGANLTDVNLSYVSMQNANLSNAVLAGADLSYGKLTSANFTGADVRGAKLSREFTYPGSGISISQLASTASYQAHDLTGIRLRGNVLTNANLANQNLTDADFVGASLVGANLTGAVVHGAQFHLHSSGQTGGLTPAQLQSTASYLAHDLRGIGLAGNNLAGANLVGQDLTDADFESGPYGANLNGADLSLANLTNARLGSSTLTSATLVGATLANLDLHLADFGNANLSEANLFGSNFGGYVIVINGGEEGGGGYYNFPGTNLTGANLAGANLTFANFSGTLDFFGSPFPGATLTNANLTGADARGASFQHATMTGANTTNLIQPNGHVAGLTLTAGKTLIVRDFEFFIGDDVPIVVDDHLTMDATGSLSVVLDADPWGSKISFAPGVAVALDGSLELGFASGVDPASQLGRTIDLFDWSGVTPTGTLTVNSPFGWDLSQLYTTGEVTLVVASGSVLGDFSGDGLVTAADLLAWNAGFGLSNAATHAQGDADGDNDVDGADFLVWQRQFGSSALAASVGPPVPEPATVLLAFLAAASISLIGVRRRR